MNKGTVKRVFFIFVGILLLLSLILCVYTVSLDRKYVRTTASAGEVVKVDGKYSTDFFVIKTNGDVFVRECVYRIKQISPVAPSLTIFASVPRNLERTSSGVRISLVVRPSWIRSYTDLPKILLCQSLWGSSPQR